ncbi:MAG: Uncharacterized protein CEN89_291 [Candidatus Berkelbacteria bacterium Licking1014_7]|uniref:Cell division protein FtsL n=1 Tax=Candidatus Berkelbacteria bacterium Licking1014_7 TaxID=2017147 RepID=A0A554LJL3_9BACT|nr:MAG: Uncharacterized protein CEN89_291 [Candidatus Berkelbacteria bacterium Licking1014_7]
MLLTNSSSVKQGVRKRTIAKTIKIGPLSLKFITMIIFASIALFYLAQTTQSATKTYKIRELRLTKEELKEENRRLEIEAIRLKSLKEVLKGVEETGLLTE